MVSSTVSTPSLPNKSVSSWPLAMAAFTASGSRPTAASSSGSSEPNAWTRRVTSTVEVEPVYLSSIWYQRAPTLAVSESVMSYSNWPNTAICSTVWVMSLIKLISDGNGPPSLLIPSVPTNVLCRLLKPYWVSSPSVLAILNCPTVATSWSS